MKISFNPSFSTVASRGKAISWTLLITFLILTLSGWYYLKTDIENTAEERFETKVNELEFSVQKRMLVYKQLLEGGRAFMLASDYVSRDDWHVYVKNLRVEENYPGIQGIGFSKVINPSEKERHIKEVKKEGFPAYKIWPDSKEEIITSIVYLEPFAKRNLRAFGYDMFSEPIRRKAMKLARDSARASLSGKVILVQETEEDIQAGCLMYVPVYDFPTMPATISERRKLFKGFVYSPFRMNDLMKGIVGFNLPGIYFSIYDKPDMQPSGFMYESSNLDGKNFTPKFQKEIKLTLFDYNWYIKIASLPEFENAIDYSKSIIVLQTGILISLLFFIAAQSMAMTWQSNKKLEQILDTTSEGIFGIDNKGLCTFINKSAEIMLGIYGREYIDQDMHVMIHHTKADGTEYMHSECPILKSMEDGKEKYVSGEKFRRSDGSTFSVEYNANPIVTRNEVKGVVVSFTDITSRLKSEAELEELAGRLEETFESITDALFIFNRDGIFTYVSHEAERLLQKTKEEMIGKNIWTVFPPAVDTITYHEYERALTENVSVHFEVFYEPLDKWFEVHAYPSKHGLTVFFRDISERKEAAEKIEASLKEKEVLLKEVHHRVKNNLQIIASLLNLQTQYIQEEGVINLVKESQNRIRSMALIHEKLYQSKNMSQINFAVYIKELVGHLLRSYSSAGNRINFRYDIDDIPIDIDKTVSLGLTINELVSNSLKHGFVNLNNLSNPAEIYVSLKIRDEQAAELIVSDNGVGFPQDIKFQETSSLGLQLVNALVAQLDGSISLMNEQGTKFIIEFVYKS